MPDLWLSSTRTPFRNRVGCLQTKPLKEKTSEALKLLPRGASVAAIDAFNLASGRGRLSAFGVLAIAFSVFAVLVALVQV